MDKNPFIYSLLIEIKSFAVLKTIYRLSFVFILFYFFHFESHAQLNASFVVDDIAGCSLHSVTFTNTSTGDFNYVEWDFNGDGTVDLFGDPNIDPGLNTPSTGYSVPGLYTVKLKISNETTADSLTRTDYITVFANPTVNFIANITEGCGTETVTFTDLSTPGDAAIDTWIWVFGDGSAVSSEQNPTHQYFEDSDPYSVFLTVLDQNGCESNLLISDYIFISPGVVPDFTLTPSSACEPPLTVTIGNLSTGEGNLAYAWDFGNGQTSELPNPDPVTYTALGVYDVTLVLSNDQCTQELTQVVTVDNNLVASFDVDLNCEGKFTQFINTSDLGFTDFTWNFGDPSSGDFNTSTLKDPSHLYETAGTYTVTMVASIGEGCEVTYTDEIVVSEFQPMEYIIPTFTVCELPSTINVEILNDNIANFSWELVDMEGNIIDFGNNSDVDLFFGNGLDEGNYFLTMSMQLETGCEDIVDVETPFTIILPIVDAFVDPVIGCVPLEVDFINLSVYNNPPENIESVSWDLGNGDISTDSTFTYTYTEAGQYFVDLTVFTTDGCQRTNNVAFVNVGEHTIPDFDLPEDTVCVFVEALDWIYTGSDNVDQWLWLGPGWSSDLENPVMPIFADPDTGYVVTLITWNLGCSDTIEVFDSLLIGLGPKPVILADPSFFCWYDSPYTVGFTNSTIWTDSTEFIWDFGNGMTSLDTIPDSVTYDAPGLYFVTLLAWDSTEKHLCTVPSTPAAIAIDKYDIISLSPSKLDYCPGENLLESVLSTNVLLTDPLENIYHWDFDDGSSIDSTIGDTTHIFHLYGEPGEYELILYGENQLGCLDTLVRTINVHNNPIADFTFSDTITCAPFELQMDDLSLPGDTGISTWTWIYAGGGESGIVTGPDAIIPIEQPQPYFVQLTVLDSLGCSNSTIQTVETTTLNIEFEVPPACNESTFSIINNTSGEYEPLEYEWIFATGDTVYTAEPSIELSGFNNDTTLINSMTVIDTTGCSFTTEFEIVITVPQLSYDQELITFSCNPFLAVVYEFSVTSTSDNIIEYKVDYGNGTSSITSDPDEAMELTAVYTTPGYYDVTFSVTDFNGCVTATTEDSLIHLQGPYASFSWEALNECPPLEVEFTIDSSENVASLLWFFGDGFTDTIFNPTHIYLGADTYFPFLWVEGNIVDPDGEIQSCVIPYAGDPIVIDGPILAFELQDDTLCESVDELVIINQSINADGYEVTLWEWDYGDGTIITQSDSEPTDPPPHIYNSSGDFVIKLTAYTNNGVCQFELSDSSLYVLPALDIKPYLDFQNSCAPMTVFFDPDTSGLIDQIMNPFWDFGDGNTSTELTPEHTYTEAGQEYFVTFSYDEGICSFIYVFDDPIITFPDPIAAFDYLPIFENNAIETIEFTNQSEGEESIQWWLDGAFYSSDNKISVSVNDDPNLLELIAYNSFGCTDTAELIIEGLLVDPVNIFTPNGDGINDALVFSLPGKEICLKLVVYNRWGKLIYEDSSYNNDWTGVNKNGKDVDDGTYFYILDICGESTIAGYVTIVR